MRLQTRSGQIVETLETAGRSTPFLHRGWYHIHLALNGAPMPSFQIMKDVWERDFREMDESDFWDMIASEAMTHSEIEAATRSGRQPTGFSDFAPQGRGFIPQQRR